MNRRRLRATSTRLSASLLACCLPASGLILCACSQGEEESASSGIAFGIVPQGAGSSKAAIWSDEDIDAIIVTVEDDADQIVYASHRMALYPFDDTYLTNNLMMTPGTYKLTEFLVVDSDSNALLATPVEGSALAHIVSDPLPIVFTVDADGITTVTPQVISTEQANPEEFGYASFGFEVVEVIDFLVAVFIFDEPTQSMTYATAGIEVTGDFDQVLYAGALDARVNHITVPGDHDDYRVAIARTGYPQYLETFTASELVSYFDADDNGPLEVVLQAASYLSDLAEVDALPTSGATDIESFDIGDGHYLAVANHHNDSTHNIDSKIYRWGGAAFVEIQSIATNGARDWEHFQIGTEHYLAVANCYNDSTYNIDSKIYRWGGAAFVEIQSIATNGALDWEHFEIGAQHYLAVANHFNDSTYNIDSKIYRWDGVAFLEIQSIFTNGASDWAHFYVGSEHYLAVANNQDGSTRNIDSRIYRWGGAAFVEIQSIATNGAFDWEHFEIGAQHYLAVANHYNGATRNIDSGIYRWDGSAFLEVQTIATNCAIDWEHFQIGNEHYLVVANHHNDSTYNNDSKIYRWDGSSFVEMQSIATNGAYGWQYLQIGDEHYLVVANHHNDSTYNIYSRVYRLVLD